MDRGGWRAAVHRLTQSWARMGEFADTTGKAPRRGIPHEPDRCAPSGLQPNVFSAVPAHRTVLTSPPYFPGGRAHPALLFLHSLHRTAPGTCSTPAGSPVWSHEVGTLPP